MFRGQISAPYNDLINIEKVKPRTVGPTGFRSKEKRFVIKPKTNLAPGAYNPPELEKTSRIRKPPVPKFSKAPLVRFSDLAQKSKKGVPALGSYDHTKFFNFATRGAARGYK